MTLAHPTITWRSLGRRLLAASIPVLLLLTASEASGSVIYSYTGNNFTEFLELGSPPNTYTTSDRVSGSLELTAPLGGLIDGPVIPLSFSFSDGVNTITNANAYRAAFWFSTDASGHIVTWVVDLRFVASIDGGSREQRITSTGSRDRGSDIFCGAVLRCDDSDERPDYEIEGIVRMSPGTWRVQTTSVPEPSSLLLLGASLAWAVALRRRRG